MIQDTIKQIEAHIRQAGSVTPEKQAELLKLIETLKAEIEQLPEAQREQARSIANFAHLSAQEATRSQQNPELLSLSLKGLSSSVTGFEQSHPKLVQIVNSICNTLSNLGI